MTEENSTGATGETEKSGADELTAALNEFDEGTSQTKPERKPEESELSEAVRLLKENNERSVRERESADLSDAVKAVKGDLEMDDRRVERFLQGEAALNESVRRAWTNRHDKPEAFQTVLKALGKQFAEENPGKLDTEATDTEVAVRAAARTASTQTDDKPLTREQWRKLTPQEKREMQQQHGVNPV